MSSLLLDAEALYADLLAGEPLLAYLPPGRFASIDQTYSFPFHTNFKR